jgi:hypothetical protein
VGAALLIGASAVACGLRPAPSVGSSVLPSPAQPVDSSIPTQPGHLPGSTAVPPVSLKIAKLRLTAHVNAVGIDAKTGDFAVPPSVNVVGWYKYGPGLEATAGSIVIAGHVDSAEQGKGAFFHLRDLDRGDRLVVTGADGRARTFSVVAREIFTKSAIPLDRFFAREGPLRLTLITCGGPFASGHYRDNVVITAVPPL